MDVSNALLQGSLDYEVFMEKAPSFCKNKNLVCNVNLTRKFIVFKSSLVFGISVSMILWLTHLNFLVRITIFICI